MGPMALDYTPEAGPDPPRTSPMPPVLRLLMAATLLLPVLAPLAHAQTPRQRTLLVTALTDEGNPVGQLSAEDVIVREDGVAREVLSVKPSSEPVDIVVLIDNSVAATRALQDIRLGVEAFVKTFAGPHTISLVTIADRPTVLVPPTTSEAQLQRGVERLFVQPDAGAYLVEGIIEQARALETRKPARGAILAISSFGVEFSDRGYQFALDALAESGASLHVIELQDTLDAGSLNQGSRDRNVVIDRGVTGTGGSRELLLANMSLRDALQKAGRVITSQFEVVYGRPDTLLPPKEVEVASARPGLKIRGNVLQANRAPR